MWERGYRHNPFSLRYQYYLDHRPALPQDDTWSFLRKSFDYYQLIYFKYKVGQNKFVYLFSNNIPIEDREKLKVYYSGYQRAMKNLLYFSIIPTVFLYQWVLSLRQPKYKLGKFVTLFFSYVASASFFRYLFKEHFEANTCYYLHKYSNLAKENIMEIEDPRRKFFRLDTNQYYRESTNDILHHEHHGDSHSGGHHHDTSNYYGPHPYDDHLVLDRYREINKKFTEGESALENELILGEPNDVKRVVRSLPSPADYRNI